MIRLTLLTLLFFISIAYSDNYAIITTSDGQKFEGAVYSKDNSIEWRKDIYEMKDEQGGNETFILKPEYTGKLNMANVSEIQRISKQNMPQNFITLTNDVKARLLLKYLIKLKNGKNFYISDFITLEHFYVDINSGNSSRRIYISQIDNLKFARAGTAQTAAAEKKDEKKSPKEIKTEIIAKASVKEIASKKKSTTKINEEKTGGVLYFFVALSSALLILITYLTIKHRLVSIEFPKFKSFHFFKALRPRHRRRR